MAGSLTDRLSVHIGQLREKQRYRRLYHAMRRAPRFLGRWLDKGTDHPDHPGRGMVAGRYLLAISHGWGGGSEAALQARLLEVGETPPDVVVAVPSRGLVRLSLTSAGRVTTAHVSRRWLLSRIEHQPPAVLLLNALPGWRPVKDLLKVVAAVPSSTRLEIPLHDYYPACPSFKLIDAHGRFCGVPVIAECAPCFPVIAAGLVDEFPTIEAWRSAWEPVLRRADTLTAYSEASAGLLRRAYPALFPVIRPHVLPNEVRRPTHTVKRGAMPRVAVFGYIEFAKGSQMLVDAATLAARHGQLIEWHVFGELVGARSVPAIKIHGRYSVEEMPRLLEEHSIVAAVLPSIWPETFSFVAEELAAMRVPFAAFPIGAPYERLAGNPLVVFAQRLEPQALLDATMKAIELGWSRFGARGEDGESKLQPDDG